MNNSEETKKIVLVAGTLIATVCEAAALILEENKKERSCWVKPWRESRDVGGNIQQLLKEYQLFADKKAYKSFIAMDENCFLEILSYVREDIERFDTRLRKCIPVEEKLAMTLRFLATGESFKELAENTKLSLSYVSCSVIEVCSAIYRKMRHIFLKFPDSEAEWIEIADNFEKCWQFPLCLGALDGKHIAMTPSKDKANLFYNYQGFHSIVLLASADAYGKFIFIDVGCNGRISHGGVLLRSVFNQFVNCDNYFPPEKVIGNNRKLPYVILADNAFPLGKHMLTPYSQNNLNMDQIRFNQRLSRARQNIERAFGMLSKRFQIFQKQIPLQEDKTKIIVQACCVLHNFLIERSEWYVQDIELSEVGTLPNSSIHQNSIIQNSISTERESECIRTQFKQYFCAEGIL